MKGNVSFVQMLSHEGYDISNVVDEDGQDVTSLLQRRGVTPMITLLHDIADFQKYRDELHTYIKNDYVEGVLGLIGNDSALITAKNKRSKCALHIAILFGNIDIVEALIKRNPVAVNAQDNVRAICFLRVSSSRCLAVAQDLIALSIRFACLQLGRTPLHYVMATSKVEEIGKLLIQAGANRQVRDVVSC